MAIQLFSNLKVITSGNKPTTAELKLGEAGFGKWLDTFGGDNQYHIFGNSDNTIVDLVLSSMTDHIGAMDLQSVLGKGNTATIGVNLEGIDGIFKATDTTGSVTSVKGSGVTVKKGTLTATMDEDEFSIADSEVGGATISLSVAHGFMDNGNTVLSGNATRVFTPAETATMRDILNIFSKPEIQGMMSTVFNFKGTVASYGNLPTTGNKIGDAWQISGTAEPDAGKIYAWVATPGETSTGAWEILGLVLDLTGYYTKIEVDNLVTATKNQLDSEITGVASAVLAVMGDVTNHQGRIVTLETDLAAHTVGAAAGTDGMHSNNNYTNVDVSKVGYLNVKDTGTGLKVLDDNGDYVEIQLIVDQI